ncbi:MAG TPA: acetyl-CoA C-acetyltransferase [Burkholderiales bacterium]|nr:acetyl-CoA C-acetyltransferase [Burkholderiales bacterium]
MTTTLRRVAILGGIRIPFARSHTAYDAFSNFDMLSAVLKAAVERFGLRGLKLGEVAAGAVIKHARDAGLTREATLASGLDPHTPAYDVQRACGTSLTALVQLGHRIAAGEIDSAIAGGVDTVSDVPISYGRRLQGIVLKSSRGRSAGERLKPWLGLRPRDLKPSVPSITEPSTGLSMGEHCELMAKEWGVGRLEQDELANESHHKAAKAWSEGFFDDLVVPFGGLKIDNNLRADSTLEKLAKLRPAYDRSGAGTLTAGNSTPLTDGASCVLLGSEAWAESRGLPIQAYLVCAASAAVDFVGTTGPREGLLMAPTYAVAEMLERRGIGLQDFDIYEIHEAFAAQVLCTLKAWESGKYCKERLGRDAPLGRIERSKLNPKGSSVAVGHPFAATGTRIIATLAKQLAQRGSGRGLASICTAGGMGVTAILER